MKTEIFLNHCDPRIGKTPEQILATINFNALLFETGVVQDNFLISQVMFDINRKYTHGHVVELLDKGIVKIAIREKVENSTGLLKEQLHEKALLPEKDSARYIPFEPSPLWEILYRDREFIEYLKQIDSSSSNGDGIYKNWVPADLGRNYRQLMMKTANEGNTPLVVSDPTEVFQEIDNKIPDTGDKKHSRTLYYNYAEKLSDEVLCETIKKWADWNYAMNLPDNLSCGTSISKEKLIQEYAHAPIQMEEWVQTTVSITSNISAKIFSPEFLTSVTARQIVDIRTYPEFKELQAVLKNGNNDEVLRTLNTYLERLSEDAERIYYSRRNISSKSDALDDGKIVIAPGMLGVCCTMVHNTFQSSVFTLNTVSEGVKKEIKQKFLESDKIKSQLGFSIHQACTVDVQPPSASSV